MFSRKTKKSKRNWVIAPLVVGLLGVSCFALWHALSIPSFAADPEETTEWIVVTGVSNVTEYLTSLVLYTDDPMSKTAVVLKYDADLNALIIEGAVNADALAIWSWNKINGSGNATLWGEKNIISNIYSNYSAIVWWKGNTINWSKSWTRSLTWSVIVWWENNTLKNVNPNSLIIWWYLNTWDAWEYQVFLWGTWSKNTSSAKYFLVLWEGGSTVSSNSVLMWKNIQAAKSGSPTYSKIFVWSDTWTFTPNYSNAFYANTSDGFWLNTSSPKLKLDISKSGVLYIKKSGQINASSQALWLECSKNKPDVKWTIAYIENWNNVWLCGCNGETWVPLSIDSFTQYACAKAGSAWTTNCLWNPSNTERKPSNWKLRWYSDGNNWSWEWKYPNWTYGGAESSVGGDRECVYTCKAWYAPRTGDASTNWNPVGWFTWSCVQCTEIANRDKWRTAWSWVDDCGFSCKGWYSYNQQARTCTECQVGEWTPADNQTWCSLCDAPARIFLYTKSNRSDADIYWWAFRTFLTTGTSANWCDFECMSGFVYSYNKSKYTSSDPYVSMTNSRSYNACASCPKGYWSEGGKNKTCKKCINPNVLNYKINGESLSFDGAYLASDHWWDENGCHFDTCDASLWLVKDSSWNCVCESKDTTHFEWWKCVSNEKYVSCGSSDLVYKNALKGPDISVLLQWHGTWNDWYWNTSLTWTYKSGLGALWTCEWRCPFNSYKDDSKKECVIPKDWACNPSYNGKSFEELSSSSSLCTYNVWSLNFQSTTEPLWWSWQCVWETVGWKHGLTAICHAVKTQKWKCAANLGTRVVQKLNGTSYTEWDGCLTEQVATWVVNYTDSAHPNRWNVWTGWFCPSSTDGDWIMENAEQCHLCDSDYTWDNKNKNRCKMTVDYFACEYWEKPSVNFKSPRYVIWSWYYKATFSWEAGTYYADNWEEKMSWKFVEMGTVTSWSTNTASLCRFTCGPWYHPNWKVCDANTYTILRKYNNWTADWSVTAYYDSTITIPNPTKVWYIFDWWDISGMENWITHYFNDLTSTSTTASWRKETIYMNLRQNDGTVTFTAKRTPITYTIKFAANWWDWSMSDMSMTYDTPKNLTANSFTKPGNSFKWWKYNSNSYANKESVNNLTTTNNGTVTMTAVWEWCAVWTYSEWTTCENCPDWYTSNAWAKAKTECYINVDAGKHKTSKTWTSTANCSVWTYKGSHKAYYNSDDNCDSCPIYYTTSSAWSDEIYDCYLSVSAWYYKDSSTSSNTSKCSAWKYKAAHNSKYGDSDSCDLCPWSYTSAAWSDEINDCYLEVSAWKYKWGVYSSTTYKCSEWEYNVAHNSKYGDSDSCSSCPTDYTSLEWATAKSSCFINVAKWKRKSTKTWTSTTDCSAWTYVGNHRAYYDSDDSCTTCPLKYTSYAWSRSIYDCYLEVSAWYHKDSSTSSDTSKCSAWYYKAKHNSYYGNSDSCTKCPSWYTSDAWATAESSCYVNVSWWKYKTSKTWSSTTNCAANTYSTDHKSYYDSSDSCTSCPSWQTSSAWATSCNASSAWGGEMEYYITWAPFLCDVYEEGDPEADKACQDSAWSYDWGWWTCTFQNGCPWWWTNCECERPKQ